jgi:hypothetical protein
MTDVPHIILTCLHGEACDVTFEPWGRTFSLRKGDVFRIETPEFSTGGVEVAYDADGIVLAFLTNAPVRIFDHKGSELFL